jgi:hypothetical protein
VTSSARQKIEGTILALLVAGGLVFAEALAQQAAEEPETAGQGDVISEDSAEESSDGQGDAADESTLDPELDDSDLDDQTYESDDDVFVPSEEIPADEPIPFPSDI